MHELNIIFDRALEEMKGDDASKLLNTMKTKLDKVVSQNETIARGMIAISDKLEDFMSKSGTLPRQASAPAVKHTMGPPPSIMAGPGRIAPSPAPHEGLALSSGAEFPPPPPGLSGGQKKKKGLFG